MSETKMHPTSKDERPRSIGNNMSMVIKVLESAVVSVSYLVHYDILLQNATDITKRNNYFIAKCDKTLSQNVSGYLLQNATAS